MSNTKYVAIGIIAEVPDGDTAAWMTKMNRLLKSMPDSGGTVRIVHSHFSIKGDLQLRDVMELFHLLGDTCIEHMRKELTQ
jgi:hypothetical protein